MLFFGKKSLENENIKEILDNAEYLTMKNQYNILIIATIVRLINNIWYVFKNVGELGGNKECQFSENLSESSM